MEDRRIAEAGYYTELPGAMIFGFSFGFSTGLGVLRGFRVSTLDCHFRVFGFSALYSFFFPIATFTFRSAAARDESIGGMGESPGLEESRFLACFLSFFPLA